jgi:hypothetical protein
MSPIVSKYGHLLVKDGKLAVEEDCCCCTCQCCTDDSLTISFTVDGGSNCDHEFTLTDGCLLSYLSDCSNATNVTVNGVAWDVGSESFPLTRICKQAIVFASVPDAQFFSYGLYSVFDINNATINPLLVSTFNNPNPTFTVTPTVEGNVSFTIAWNCPTPNLGFFDPIPCGEPCGPITKTKVITMIDGKTKCPITRTSTNTCGQNPCFFCCNGVCVDFNQAFTAGCFL